MQRCTAACGDPPRHSRGERAADAVVHVIGVSAALVACALLAAAAPRPPGARLTVVLYNLAGAEPRKAPLHRLDHAVIFAMTAGTHTPVALLAMGGTWDAASTTDGSDDAGKGSDWLRIVSGSMARNSRHPCLQLRAFAIPADTLLPVQCRNGSRRIGRACRRAQCGLGQGR